MELRVHKEKLFFFKIIKKKLGNSKKKTFFFFLIKLIIKLKKKTFKNYAWLAGAEAKGPLASAFCRHSSNPSSTFLSSPTTLWVVSACHHQQPHNPLGCFQASIPSPAPINLYREIHRNFHRNGFLGFFGLVDLVVLG